MEQIYTGPGKISIELTVPDKKKKPGWKQALEFIGYGLFILVCLNLLYSVTSGMTW